MYFHLICLILIVQIHKRVLLSMRTGRVIFLCLNVKEILKEVRVNNRPPPIGEMLSIGLFYFIKNELCILLRGQALPYKVCMH